MRSLSSLHWEKFKNRIKSRWEDIRDEELESCRSDFNLISSVIQKHSRESKDIIRNFVDNLWFEIYVRGGRHGSHSLEIRSSLNPSHSSQA